MAGAYFCLDAYRRILERARALDYRICEFRTFPERDARPILLVRHDLDHSLICALPMARLEAELGVRATYFVQVACDFYNLLSKTGRACVRELTQLGHEVGLHYESERYLDGGNTQLRLEMELLSDISGQPCLSGSQHVPIASPGFDAAGSLVNEAYAPRFTRSPMHYISDSLLAWRQATPDALLDRGVSFQFLTHPENWPVGEPARSFEDAIDRALQLERDSLEQNRCETLRFYRELLDRRAELDRAFEARRAAEES